MKKVLSMIAVGVFIFSMTSCTKDYTCECKDSSGAVLATATQKSKKKDAETYIKFYVENNVKKSRDRYRNSDGSLNNYPNWILYKFSTHRKLYKNRKQMNEYHHTVVLNNLIGVSF